MAINFKNPRLINLSPEDQRVVNQLEVRFPGILQSIQKTGSIPQEILQQMSPNESAYFQKILKDLPGTQYSLEKYLGRLGGIETPVDLATLSEEELQNRVGAYRELQQPFNTYGEIDAARGFDEEGFKKFVYDTVKKDFLPSSSIGTASEEANRGYIEKYANDIVEKFKQDPNVSTDEFPQEFRKSVGEIGRNYGKFTPVTGSDFGQQISDIQNVLDMRNTQEGQEGQEGQIDQFLTSLPEELSRGREQFLVGERQAAEQQFTEKISPRIMAELNARGILSSGDLPSELARAGGEVQLGLESQEAQLRQEDEDFFANAAYQTTLRRELQAGETLQGNLEFQRGLGKQQQSRNFQRSQADLQSQFDERMFRRDQQRQLELQRGQLQRQRDAQEKQQRNAIIRGIGTSVGTIGGAFIGGGVGAGIGGSIGGIAGEGFSS